MQFVTLDKHGIYQGMVAGIPGDVPDSWVSPSGILISDLQPPPTDEPGKWRDAGNDWQEVTPEEIKALIMDAIQERLDTFAQTRYYDNILSAASYATSEIPQWQTEGQYAVAIRDATWAKAHEILMAVEAEEQEFPIIEEVMAELPELKWPADTVK